LNHTFETSRPRLKSPATKMLFFSK
jgi:hypothetical protein